MCLSPLFHPLSVPQFHPSFSPCSPLQLVAVTQQCRFWTGQKMTDIFRPTQPLDGRVVYRSDATAVLPRLMAMLLCAQPVVLVSLVLGH